MGKGAFAHAPSQPPDTAPDTAPPVPRAQEKEAKKAVGQPSPTASVIEFFHPCILPTATAQTRRFSKSGRNYLPESTRQAAAFWQAIMEQHRPAVPITGAVRVAISLLWPSKNGTTAPKATRPDCDNLSKLILDGMTKARYWHDDAQVADLHIKKFTSDTPGAYVFVARIGGDK